MYMVEESGVYRVLVGKPDGRRPLGSLGVDGWIIFGRISRGWNVGIWTALCWPRKVTACDGDNGPSDSVKFAEILD